MAGEVTLPAVGPVSKRTLYIGGGLAAAVMALLWWRKRSSSPATVAAGSDSSTDPALAGDPSGLAGGGGALVGPSTSSAAAPTSNPQWTQLVLQNLTGVIDAPALSAALGKYLTGAAVTPDEESLIDQAIAVAGYPPVAGPTGYPPAIRTQPSTGQTPPPSPPPPGPVYEHVSAGQLSDPWINSVGARFGYGANAWTVLTSLNGPDLPANISLNRDPAKRAFISGANYKVKA